MRHGSNKEMTAVVVNLKEQRCLEKSLQTLDLQRSYIEKLEELDYRIMTINFMQLKDKVRKVRSNLTADQIVELRRLETQGKLGSAYKPITLNSAIKIATTAKLLKLWPETTDRASKAGGRSKRNCFVPTSVRRQSIVGAFMDATVSPTRQRPASVANFLPRPESEATERTTRARVETKAWIRGEPCPDRPITCIVGRRQHPAKRPVTAPVTLSFSSHSLDDDTESNSGEDLYDERRKEFLELEKTRGKRVEEKRRKFLADLDRFIAVTLAKSSASPQETCAAVSISSLPLLTSGDSATCGVKRLQRKISEVELFGQMTAEEYDHHILELWKDLNKCRYLRIPNEKNDLSGVVTLAKEQLKMFRA